MQKIRALVLAATAPAFLVAGAAHAESTRASSQSMGGAGNSQQCTVDIGRRAADGTYDLKRRVLPNGDCVCVVKTGRQPQSTTIEAAITQLTSTGDCADAPVEFVQGGGLPGGVVPALVVGGGAAAAAASSGTDSPGGGSNN